MNIRQMIGVMGILVCGIAMAQAPNLVNYQGTLVNADGEPVANGNYVLRFNIYEQASLGTAIWGPKTYTGVPVVDGQFNVILGDKDDTGGDGRSLGQAFFGSNRFLGVTITATPSGPVQNPVELAPRQQILSVPYALNSAGSILTGFDFSALPTNPNPVGKVVEVIPGTRQLRLSYDIPGQEDLRQRGIYLGGGSIQIAGVVSTSLGIEPRPLDENQLYYLSGSPTSLGTLVKKDAIVGRGTALHVGLALKPDLLQLNFRKALLNDLILTSQDKENLLYNGNFDLGPLGWDDSGINDSQRIVYREFCGTDTHVGDTYQDKTTQIVDLFDGRLSIPATGLEDLIASGALSVRWGGRGQSPTAPSGRLNLEFHDNVGIIGSALQIVFPMNSCSAPQERTDVIPPTTRKLKMEWFNTGIGYFVDDLFILLKETP